MIRLNEKQFEKLSDIASDIALVSIASIVLPAVFERFNTGLGSAGLAVAIGFWSYSI